MTRRTIDNERRTPKQLSQLVISLTQIRRARRPEFRLRRLLNSVGRFWWVHTGADWSTATGGDVGVFQGSAAGQWVVQIRITFLGTRNEKLNIEHKEYLQKTTLDGRHAGPAGHAFAMPPRGRYMLGSMLRKAAGTTPCP
jgi:hypothetical protein